MISATTTAGTSATLSVSKQRMISMMFRSPSTRRYYYDSFTSQRTPSFFSGISSLSVKSYRTLSTLTSVDSFSLERRILPPPPPPPSEPQLALAYDYVDYDSDTEENDYTNSAMFNSSDHHMNISYNQSTTNFIPVHNSRGGTGSGGGGGGGGDGHNMDPPTNTDGSGSLPQYHGKSYSGGGGGSGGSSRHRCPKVGLSKKKLGFALFCSFLMVWCYS
jgi:hypothetical protein